MTSWAITFLVFALIAAVLALSGLTGTAATVAWWCTAMCVVVAIAFSLLGRKPPE
jgi:uncharacterized membrane protein YtjA (UPF0391 family)